MGGALIAAALGVATRAPADDKFMKVADITPGMKGYGLSVFSGTKPEKFDVEVISIMTNFRPAQDLVLVKTIHPKLEIARTVAGMSGSPVYLTTPTGPKMIGAYAYGWLFGIEPIAGVTPIHDMLADLKRPLPTTIAPVAGRGPLPSGGGAHGARPHSFRDDERRNRYAGAPLEYDMRAHVDQIATHLRPVLAPPEGSELRAASTDLMIAGVGPRSARFAAELFEPLGMNVMQGGGTGGKPRSAVDGEAPEKFVDGGVITVQLVRGDFGINGLGTVTYVEGDKLVAFGHPMMQGGLEDLPTGLGTVHWVLATTNRSFKLGEPTTPLGSLVNDRQASIVIDQKRVPATFPVNVDLVGYAGAPKTHWTMEGTADQFFAPSVAAMCVGSALEAAASERGEQTWRSTSKVTFDGGQTLTFEDFGAGSGAPIGPGDFARSRMVRAIGALLNNPWKLGRIEAVDSKVEIVLRREVQVIRGAELLDPEVEPGQKARVRLSLQNYLGDVHTQEIEIPIARTLAGDVARIELRPAYLMDRVVSAPENYQELVEALGKMDFPAEAIVASYNLPDEATATFHGHVVSRMPPGMADAMMSHTSSVGPDFYAAQEQIVIPTKGYVVGQENIEVKVRNVLK